MSKCKICRAEFVKRSISHKCCSPECAEEFARRERNKKEMREYHERKRKLKTRRDYLKEAQTAFNAFIRERDKDKPCICCGKPLGSLDVGGAYDCGHYRSVGSAPHLRFDERNAHAQRKQCNRYDSGRAVDYRIGLIKRIGVEEVEAIESDNTARHFSIDDLIEITKEFKAKRKALKREDVF